MLRTERQNQIVDLINKKGIATIEELMAGSCRIKSNYPKGCQ